MEVSTIDHLTNNLQVTNLSDQNLEQLNELHTRLRDEPKLLQSTIREQLACDMIEEVTPEMDQEDTNETEMPEEDENEGSTKDEQDMKMSEKITTLDDGSISFHNKKSRPRSGMSANRPKVLLRTPIRQHRRFNCPSLKCEKLSTTTMKVYLSKLNIKRCELRKMTRKFNG
ncbi:Uncharacterized protein BM_BM8237 [Brugia malayi]|uniref:Bm8237 n=1 Tax=Brugia malayi TaxID=6279 RepID=A0A0K0JV78_BRUMA|nr:Uncharacterized protein BM_BM8237 [Brugia malayi]CDQ06562.1 Bm8237 [Brugia malayi]VIP00355.1 Uncharacterized protein BM_BM8237 [Brugia malayi]